MQRLGRGRGERGIQGRSESSFTAQRGISEEAEGLSAEFAGRGRFRDDGGDLRGGGPQRVRDHDLDREGFEFRIGQRQKCVEFWRQDGGDGLRFKRARKAINEVERLGRVPHPQARECFFAEQAVGAPIQGQREQAGRGGGRAETEVGVERAARDHLVGRTRVDERGELGQRSGNAAFVVDRTGGFGDDEWIGIV